MVPYVFFIYKGKAVPLHAMEALGGEEVYSSYSFSTSALDGGEWSASHPGRAFTPWERTPSTHCTGGWVGTRAGLDREATGKILCLCRGSNPNRPVVQPVVRHYTAWANPAPSSYIAYTNIKLCVCMYVIMYVCILCTYYVYYVCMSVCMYVCMYVCLYVCLYQGNG
jgi:hypothetical protein